MNRFLWAVGGDMRRLRLAALCQFTLLGAPVIYYGTEVGLSQIRDVRQDGRGLPEESRLPMIWGSEQNTELLNYYHDLIKVRRDFPALGHEKTRIVRANKDILIYSKEVTEKLSIVINVSPETQKVNLPKGLKKILLKTGDDDAQYVNFELTLSPFGGAIILTR